MPVYRAAAAVVAQGVALFPKSKPIILKISLARSTEQAAPGAGHCPGTRLARRQLEPAAVADEKDKGKARANSDSDRSARGITTSSPAGLLVL